jgi:peptidoglycan/xylan/chitin deacetylase (PgdA/CDA1 family)
LGAPARGFAYPNGTAADYSRETIEVLNELGVAWACTTRSGFVRPGAPAHELPRIYTSMDSLEAFACRLAGLTRLPADDAGALAG